MLSDFLATNQKNLQKQPKNILSHEVWIYACKLASQDVYDSTGNRGGWEEDKDAKQQYRREMRRKRKDGEDQISAQNAKTRLLNFSHYTKLRLPYSYSREKSWNLENVAKVMKKLLNFNIYAYF